MVSPICVVRVSEDGLEQQSWRFCLIDLEVILDQYSKGKLPSKRHRVLHNEAHYDRLSLRASTMKLAAVPLPDDVAAEARKQVTDQVKVVREYLRG
jgi:hypothetical protein